jgi:hypothetical protein
MDAEPSPVVFEPLPDGAANVRLYRNARQETKTGDEDGEEYTVWTADEVFFRVPAARAAELDAEMIQADFAAWWTHGEAWQPETPQTVEDRLDELEALIAEMI